MSQKSSLTQSDHSVRQALTAYKIQATVSCRLLMPFELAEQLTRTLADSLIKARQATRQTPETETATRRAEKTDNFADRIFSDSSRLRS